MIVATPVGTAMAVTATHIRIRDISSSQAGAAALRSGAPRLRWNSERGAADPGVPEERQIFWIS